MASSVFDGLKQILSDRYHFEREVGAGGTAIVYLARDQRHNRMVAIKVLRPEVSAAIGPERFVQEIQVAAQLTHPHILPLYDSGSGDGLLYYVMPFVEGESLRDHLAREQQLPVREATAIARDVAKALAYSHRRGILHRDIEPDAARPIGNRTGLCEATRRSGHGISGRDGDRFDSIDVSVPGLGGAIAGSPGTGRGGSGAVCGHQPD